jgi:hypothetical protein
LCGKFLLIKTPKNRTTNKNSSMKTVFSGSEILASKVKEELTINNINVIERNDTQSALLAGFGVLGTSVILMVNEEDVAQAEKIIEVLGL